MSEALIEQYRRMAATGEHLRGLTILRYRDQISKLVRTYGAKSLLDFGCGAGEAWKQPHRLHAELGLRWFDVTLYDPAFKQHEEKPHGAFDGVLCSDVLEHIPEDELDATVRQLFAHARRFVWASVCCRPAAKTFPDGTNLHVTLQPMPWWQALFDRHSGGVPFFLVESP
ncbi:MAG: methyltransferase domain-containing protein [Rubrivivax sp.]|nr:methyltransferase domain-containing protein [Rubrivivax sp.]